MAENLAASRQCVEGGPSPLRRARPRARAAVESAAGGLDGAAVVAPGPHHPGAARVSVAAPRTALRARASVRAGGLGAAGGLDAGDVMRGDTEGAEVCHAARLYP